MNEVAIRLAMQQANLAEFPATGIEEVLLRPGSDRARAAEMALSEIVLSEAFLAIQDDA